MRIFQKKYGRGNKRVSEGMVGRRLEYRRRRPRVFLLVPITNEPEKVMQAERGFVSKNAASEKLASSSSFSFVSSFVNLAKKVPFAR